MPGVCTLIRQHLSSSKFNSLTGRLQAIVSLSSRSFTTTMSAPSDREPHAKDMPAAAAFTSFEQLLQEEGVEAPAEQQLANSGTTSSNTHDATDTSSHAHRKAPEPVPPARPTGTLQDMDSNDLVTKRNQILWEQATKGQQPGLTLMQDKLSGDNKQETWGMHDSIMEPEREN